MKRSVFGIFMSFALAGQGLAEVKFEGPSELKTEEACVTSAYDAIDRYLDLFVQDSNVVKVRFNSLVNTTRGTYRQQYFANITLFDERGQEFGEDQSTLEVTFQAGEVCDGLRILNLVDKGVDTNNPLYACLNDPDTIGLLYAARTQAYDAYEKAQETSCGGLETASERVACYAQLKKSSEGQQLQTVIDAAKDKVDAATMVCRDEHLKL